MGRGIWTAGLGLVLAALLAACGGGGGPGSGGGSGGGGGGPIAVTGKVIDPYGLPLSGLVVQIGGQSATTGSDGGFSIPGVTPPYDAAVISSMDRAATVYKGLTRPDPLLQTFFYAETGARHADLSGNLSGGAGFPNPPDHKTLVFFGSPETLTAGGSVGPGGGPAYGPFNAVWVGPASTSGKIYALQIQLDPTSGLPVQYKGYGERAVTLADGGSFANQDITLSSVLADSFSGAVNPPSGYAVTQKGLFLRLGPGAGVPLLKDLSSVSSFSYATPRLNGATLTLLASALDGSRLTSAWRTGLPTNASGVSLALNAAPTLGLPVNGATGVTTGTDFTTTGFSGGVNIFHFQPPTPSYPEYYVVTGANTARIPDLSGAGLGLPTSGGVNYEWQVLAFAPFASTDAAAAPGGGGFLSGYVKAFILSITGDPGPDSDGSIGHSETRTFKTP